MNFMRGAPAFAIALSTCLAASEGCGGSTLDGAAPVAGNSDGGPDAWGDAGGSVGPGALDAGGGGSSHDSGEAATSFACTDSTPCAPGQVCCGTFSTPGASPVGPPVGSTCRTGPCPAVGLAFQLCSSSAECLGGAACVTNRLGMICVGGGDGGTDAAPVACYARSCLTDGDCCSNQTCIVTGATEGTGPHGACFCGNGFYPCGDGCFDLATDSRHCGWSCAACQPGDTCTAAECVPADGGDQ